MFLLRTHLGRRRKPPAPFFQASAKAGAGRGRRKPPVTPASCRGSPGGTHGTRGSCRPAGGSVDPGTKPVLNDAAGGAEGAGVTAGKEDAPVWPACNVGFRPSPPPTFFVIVTTHPRPRMRAYPPAHPLARHECDLCDLIAGKPLISRNRDQPRSALTKSAQRSPIMIDGALVLPLTSRGMTEASATYSPSTPRTRSFGSQTASASDPIRAVPTGW